MLVVRAHRSQSSRRQLAPSPPWWMRVPLSDGSKQQETGLRSSNELQGATVAET